MNKLIALGALAGISVSGAAAIIGYHLWNAQQQHHLADCKQIETTQQAASFLIVVGYKGWERVLAEAADARLDAGCSIDVFARLPLDLLRKS